MRGCTRCGKCCTEYAVTMNDILLPKRLKKDYRELFNAWGLENTDETVAIKKPCRHLAGNVCGIYEKRPKICREFMCADALETAGYNGKVLVGCVTFAGKEPALEKWHAAYKAIDYDQKYLYVVDNTGESDGYLRTLRSLGIDSTRIFPSPKFEDTYRRGWELILQKAKELNCYWVYSIEADNIVAPESLKVMLGWAMVGNGKEGDERVGGLEENIHIVTHGYPLHASAAKASNVSMDSFRYQEMGCMLMSTQLLEIALAKWANHRNIPNAIMSNCKAFGGKHIYLDWQFDVQHLDTYETEFWQFEQMDEYLPNGEFLINPAPVCPPEYGTKRPKSLEAK